MPTAAPSCRKRIRLSGILHAAAPNLTFQLLLADGTLVACMLKTGTVLDLSTFISDAVTIDGMAAYETAVKVAVEAEQIRTAANADSFFSAMPSPPTDWIDLDDMTQRNAKALREAFGKWPGNETDEQILKALKELG